MVRIVKKPRAIPKIGRRRNFVVHSKVETFKREKYLFQFCFLEKKIIEKGESKHPMINKKVFYLGATTFLKTTSG
jgi:hypothetical protein